MKIFGRRGQGLIGALVAVGVVGLAAAGIPSIVHFINKRNQILKVKAAMAFVGAKLQLHLNDPANYNGCPAACQIVDPWLAGTLPVKVFDVLGAQCDPANVATCGILAKQISYVGDAVEVTIEYSGGTPLPISEEVVHVRIPQHQLEDANCDETKPVFEGIDVGGNPICRKLDPCPAGSFLTTYDRNTMAPTCLPIHSGLVNCTGPTDTQFISTIRWSPNLTPSLTCTPRLML